MLSELLFHYEKRVDIVQLCITSGMDPNLWYESTSGKDAKVQDGGAALVAFGKMQFTKMSDEEKSALVAALLQYCELDTLAMVMLFEHWLSLESKKN